MDIVGLRVKSPINKMVYQSSNAKAMSKSFQTTRNKSEDLPIQQDSNKNRIESSSRQQTRYSAMTHDDMLVKNQLYHRQQQFGRDSSTAMQKQRSHSVMEAPHLTSNSQYMHSNIDRNERKQFNANDNGRSNGENGFYRNNCSFSTSSSELSLSDIYANDLAEVI